MELIRGCVSEVVKDLRASILGRLKRGQEVFPEVRGREKVKADILMALLSGGHPYLVSQEGTGKTLIAKAVARLLPPIRALRGCPFRDRADGPRDELCPGCLDAAAKGALEVEIIPGPRRLSRIQGNEFTNEAKLLGVKDIRKLAEGASASDPRTFLGTGVFQAHRGILFLDELPAVRTKVQVLLHPILDEGKVALEEFSWERRIDLVMIATGNPWNFAHVNEVPRPLLDRLEMIWVDLPDERDEAEIMIAESFGAKNSDPAREIAVETGDDFQQPEVLVPWWIREIIVKAVRNSRDCPRLEWGASIRGSIKAYNHTLSSAEIEGRKVAGMCDAIAGLKLALRGRVKLAQEYAEPNDARGELQAVDAITEDCARIALDAVAGEMAGRLGAEGIALDALAREALPAAGREGREAVKLALVNEDAKKFFKWTEAEEARRLSAAPGDLKGDAGSKRIGQAWRNEGWGSAAIEFLLASAASLGFIEEKSLGPGLALPKLFKDI